MEHYPIFASLHQRPVLLVGAGSVAERKAESLLMAGAQLRVTARTLSPTFETWRQAGRIEWLGTDFLPTHLDGVFLVVSATGHPDVDEAVFRAAEAAGKLCNTVDDQPRCSYIVPAIVDRSPVQIAISSAGTAPVLARRWRQAIEALVPAHVGKVADIAGRWRQRVQRQLPTLRERRLFWERLFAGPFDSLVAARRYEAAETELVTQLAGHQTGTGELAIVITDVEQADLLSLRALQLLQAADVAVIDERVADDVRLQVRKDAHRAPLGTQLPLPQRPDRHSTALPTHDDGPLGYLLAEARKGQRVVLLASTDALRHTGPLRSWHATAEATGVPCRIAAPADLSPQACPTGQERPHAGPWDSRPSAAQAVVISP